MPRKLRKGRDRCEARRKDGQPCQAPAIEGGTVCRVHGGSAPQVALAAERRVLLERRYLAYEAWQAEHDRGHQPGQLAGPREVSAMVAVNAAEFELEQFESDVGLIALMRMELADPSGPEVWAALLEVARARLAGRPWILGGHGGRRFPAGP